MYYNNYITYWHEVRFSISTYSYKKYVELNYFYHMLDKIIVHKNGLKKLHSANPKKLKWTSKPWDQIQESIEDRSRLPFFWPPTGCI